MSENEAAALVFSFSSSFSSSSSIFGGFRGRERGRGGGLKLIFRQALRKNFPRHCLLSKTVILQAKKEKRPPSARLQTALGGLMSGVDARPSKSARVDACPSARNASAWKHRPAPSSPSVSILQATTPSWPPSQMQNSGPCSFSPIVPNKSHPALPSLKNPALKTTRQRAGNFCRGKFLARGLLKGILTFLLAHP